MPYHFLFVPTEGFEPSNSIADFLMREAYLTTLLNRVVQRALDLAIFELYPKIYFINPSCILQSLTIEYCASDGTRTHDPRFKRPQLSPTELQRHLWKWLDSNQHAEAGVLQTLGYSSTQHFQICGSGGTRTPTPFRSELQSDEPANCSTLPKLNEGIYHRSLMVSFLLKSLLSFSLCPWWGSNPQPPP